MIILMNEKSQTGFMHTLKLGKGEGFACETTQSLAQGIVPSFHMGRFTGFFSHGSVIRKDFIISAPKVAVGGTSFVGPWQTLVKFPATIPIPRPNGIGEDLTGASAKSDPNPLGIALAPHKRPQFVQFNDIMAAGRKNRAFERSQRLSFFLTNSKRCWDSPRRRAVNRVDCCVPDRLEGSFLFALRCISLWGFRGFVYHNHGSGSAVYGWASCQI